MDFEKWYRKEERKATALLWKGSAMVLAAPMASGMLKGVAATAPALIQPILSVFLWGPTLFMAGAIVTVAAAGWKIWRLHSDPFSLYEDH
ncbi:hypothetical protein MNR01_02395 [Lysobacter sp. S4-A87]|uniref:hypothetical protein n=1 Tax=Lysobacter sp. S4-A87 TaxID=2925843 RepID=UPI001F52B633|nr:hypothetical protein [Lysobacter sp. S4-A87]UNK49908.1 hypothetical protein MNR01_02395 [Lysobacter sp. S4-A87]